MLHAVTPNDANTAVNDILEISSELEDASIAMQIYEMTLKVLG
eukprot:CAMPEP_0201284622 /NCGR_PEP_ID=MMETSP1317-20130820/79829_1 /ASSEMBLY_ACC=CAM_ASM_000770 /TAXON_ID=187299 /ORGANISM="Undescribed Undescribed, Strain Undescribed" /LENGTH=42 /DNA_ID= /DNA_START= /DNA_END= /DNA_ORIENTATION=